MISVFIKIKVILVEYGFMMVDVYKFIVFVVVDFKWIDGKMDFVGMNDGYKMFFGMFENFNLVVCLMV